MPVYTDTRTSATLCFCASAAAWHLLVVQMVLGLNHMHVRKILHRDFKALNVFLDDKLNVKLGDMGVAKVGGTRVCRVCRVC